MNKIDFHKYQGTGNDFVLIDDRKEQLARKNSRLYRKWCDRKFGVGADGLIILRNHERADFEMLYYNADGKPGSLCGNGSRCIVDFYRNISKSRKKNFSFVASDGIHHAKIHKQEIQIQMSIPHAPQKMGKDWVIDTGSPHYIQFLRKLPDHQNAFDLGRSIRNSKHFKSKGINVNFVSVVNDRSLEIITYERGVENITLSCGTGVTAAAIAHLFRKKVKTGRFQIRTKNPGGILKVNCVFKNGQLNDLWLCGPAELSFKGTIEY